jgi:hypothetical protein
MGTTTGPNPAQRGVVDWYLRWGGCIRRPNEARRPEGSDSYKKGWEVRFYVATKRDAVALQKLLKRAELRGGRPYKKTPKRWIQPLYGRESVGRFMEWLDSMSSVGART